METAPVADLRESFHFVGGEGTARRPTLESAHLPRSLHRSYTLHREVHHISQKEDLLENISVLDRAEISERVIHRDMLRGQSPRSVHIKVTVRKRFLF